MNVILQIVLNIFSLFDRWSVECHVWLIHFQECRCPVHGQIWPGARQRRALRRKQYLKCLSDFVHLIMFIYFNEDSSTVVHGDNINVWSNRLRVALCWRKSRWVCLMDKAELTKDLSYLSMVVLVRSCWLAVSRANRAQRSGCCTHGPIS